MKQKIVEFLIAMIFIFGLFAGGVLIAALMSEDIDRKGTSLCLQTQN